MVRVGGQLKVPASIGRRSGTTAGERAGGDPDSGATPRPGRRYSPPRRWPAVGHRILFPSRLDPESTPMARNVLITGCSSGFGRQLAERLARSGDRVYATMRGIGGRNAPVAAELSALAAAEGLDLRVLELDVTSTTSVDAAAAEVLTESGAPDLLVNNAGQMFVGITEAFSADELMAQLDINVVGVHRVNRAFLPAMRQRGSGLVVQISSVAGRAGLPFFGVYHASKWGLEGYSMALRGELASSGIDVVVVEPGPFTTDLFPRSPRPADADGRGASYPPLVHETFAQMGAAFEGLFADPDAPTDPGLVVERIVELAAMPAGTRPFRSVVGADFGVRALNEVAEPREAAVLDAMGLTPFTTLR
jgi:NAD(P)-dependent dehydrogenase (short-subunit alcohol dehydrogenase family)